MKAVYLKELRTYFRNPLGYVFIAVIFAVFAVFYSIYTLYGGYASFGGTVLSSAAGLLSYLIPMLTMRSFAEESKNKTDQLLLTAPIRTWDIVLGKFFAAVTIVAIALALTFVLPATTVIVFRGQMDWSMTFGGYLATFLLCAAFTALGMFVSSMTDNQLVSVLVALVCVVLFSILNGVEEILPADPMFSLVVILILFLALCAIFYFLIRNLTVMLITAGAGLAILLAVYFIAPGFYENLFGNILGWLNIMTRYSKVFSGTFDLSQLFYFFGFAAFFLFLTQQRLESKRWS